MSARQFIAAFTIALLFATPTVAAEADAVGEARINCTGEPTGSPLIDNLFQNVCDIVSDLCNDVFNPCILE